jgi:isoleucyl-tRNA synthetase
MFLQEQYLHDYPFCWRAEQDPLIQYPRKSWFIRTTRFRELMLKNNAQIGWQPEHIRDGRFGNFLESNVDWALSRERYWGTPLPIWVCDQTGRMEAVGSYDELLAKPGVSGTEVWQQAKADNPELVDDLRVHKPYIDAVTYDSPFASGSRMRRVSEVIDCWYDSGAMPFAQWGWPHTGDEQFHSQFPADFISEAIDQTRGWFYSQLAIATMLFGEGSNISEPGHQTESPVGTDADYPIPFRNCIVLGLMLSQWWEHEDDDKKKIIVLDESETQDGEHAGKKFHKQVGKMSKSLRNYRSPEEIFQRYGADALRWYLFANQAPWNSIIYAEQSIKDSIPEFLLRLWNTFSFFTIYAEIDGFDPRDAAGADEQLSPQSLASAAMYRPAAERSEIDRWILSELNQATAKVIDRMDALDNYNACQAISSLLDGLSNWYVRRSRDRFWASDKQSQDKHDAYWTLYESLLELVKLAAPFTPFLADTLWRRLTEPFGDKTLESVHLCDFPASDPTRIDVELSDAMRLLREIASLGRAARASEKLKVRLPLAEVTVILTDDSKIDWLQSHDALVREELNVKAVHYTTDGGQYVQYTVVPNFKRLGPKVGKQVPAVKKALASADGNALLNELQSSGVVKLQLGNDTIELDGDDIEVRLQAKAGWAAAQGVGCVVVLNTEVTPELQREGIAKDLIRVIQNQRKAIECQYTDRIEVAVDAGSDDVRKAIEEHGAMIAEETLADSLTVGIGGGEAATSEHGDVYVSKVGG